MIRRPALWRTCLAAAVLPAPAALIACSNIYADPITDPSPTFATSSFDSGLTAPRIPPVPCNEPAHFDGPCPSTGAICESGTSPDPKCNTLFRCEATSAGLAWDEQQPAACEGKCPANIVEGEPCTVTQDGGVDPNDAELICTTSSATCACTTGPDGAHAHERKWVCVLPTPSCPLVRPLFGKPCVGDHSCDYGACEFKRGSRMICQDEVWQTEQDTCD